MPLFPRLPTARARELVEVYRDHSIDELTGSAAPSSKDMRFAEVGGARVSEIQLMGLRERLVDTARACGFPGKSDTRAFDAKAGVALYENCSVSRGEALRVDTWSFLTLVLLPDIAVWRFPDRHPARLLGGVRNTFQRCWRRAWLLEGHGAEKWRVLESLSEDAFVQIAERPGPTASPRVARALGLAWCEMAKSIGAQKMQPVHRGAMKRVLALGMLVTFDALSDSELLEMLREIFHQERAQRRRSRRMVKDTG